LEVTDTASDPEHPERVSVQLQQWLDGDGDKTVDGLVSLFGRNSFALLFVILLGVPALPLPTGGVTHVFEVIAILLALQLVLGRDDIWLPKRWRGLQLAGASQQKFLSGLLKVIRWLERFSRPRGRFLFEHRLTDVTFGTLVIIGSVAAFVAPPFSGLDTLPAIGVVLLALAVLLEDALGIVLGLVAMTAGIALELVLGRAAIHGVSSLL
jgi:hypothetical protein